MANDLFQFIDHLIERKTVSRDLYGVGGGNQGAQGPGGVFLVAAGLGGQDLLDADRLALGREVAEPCRARS